MLPAIKMKILELFSGTESFSKIAEARGHEVFTIDINPKFNPSLCKDVLLLKKEDVPFAPDLIWASPPCTEYSHAKRGGERDIEGANKNVLKAIELIKEFNPKFWIIENPQTGLLKNQSFMQSLPFADASYCKYGMTYRKQTRFWNNFNLKLSTCNKDCDFFVNGRHIDSVGNGRKKYAKFQRLSWETKRKYAVPEKLCLVILKSVEQLIANSPTLPNGNPNGEFNKGDKVSATPTPKCPTDTSHHPNIICRASYSRHGKARRGMARHGEARRGLARQGKVFGGGHVNVLHHGRRCQAIPA